MSFFGFEQNDRLQQEKQRFREGKLEQEDLAVYTWGEDSYDGLGDALQEGGDELNDETFGGTEQVGKDFDFTQQTLLIDDQLEPLLVSSDNTFKQPFAQSDLSRDTANAHGTQASSSSRPGQSLWDEKSPFSVLPRSGGTSRSPADHVRNGSVSSSNLAQSHSPSASAAPQTTSQTGVRTLQDIEAEMKAVAIAQRMQNAAVTQRQQLMQEQQHAQQPHHYQQQRSAPPRMHPQAQSPRFHQQLQQQQLIQQQQLREQQLHEQLQLQFRQQQMLEQERERMLQEAQLQEQIRERQLQELQLQEQLRLDQMERQLRSQRPDIRQHQIIQNHQHLHQRPSSDLPLPGTIPPQQLVQRRQQSPAFIDPHLQPQYQQKGQYMPQNIQLQQRLLSEMAQAEFMRDMQAVSQAEQDALQAEAMRRIMETERMEEKRRRKAAKIAHMSRYNDLMTQSDKDFITRIQVSQLVTQDPYADDFYAQVYSAIVRSRLGLQPSDERVLKFGAFGGVGLGMGQKGAGRRPSAMQKMEQQVERIVHNARQREQEKPVNHNNLQGALGKTSGRSYKAAPRQLLQVDSSNSSSHAHISKEDAIRKHGEGAAKEAAKIGAEALGVTADPDDTARRDPLSTKEALTILEYLYDLVLDIEQIRREQSGLDAEGTEAAETWNKRYSELVQQLWDDLRVMVPLETSNPHPFISLIAPSKGKKLLPRISRHLSSQQMLTVLTLLVACFSQMDIVVHASILDVPEESTQQQDLERQTQAFLGSVVQSILPVIAKAGLRLVSGLLGLLLERSDIVSVTQTRPGLAILTLFLSRVELIKQSMSTATELSELPTQDETEQCALTPQLALPFPFGTHCRRAGCRPPNTVAPTLHTETLDQPVWQFLAALALHATNEQQQALVTALREKVLENVASANKGWVADEDERRAKLGNVNLFLHALGLDSSQISI
ncbi:topoisomerase II-associated protein PAT1 [Multifurca ochricompacta]|uniref:Topoisomerase II-associated protein PAT1 n=1 Tax=Multifurca ochricompacta TaxID=376703 RepID=A0AAD4M9B9_9AGAM|nr:topoisomerase II-associated protein PAT1 [Multifurca ochricompacta]